MLFHRDRRKELFETCWIFIDKPVTSMPRTAKNVLTAEYERICREYIVKHGLSYSYKNLLEDLGKEKPFFPNESPQKFERLLEYFWNQVIDSELEMSKLLSALTNAFPTAEYTILKSAFKFFINSIGLYRRFAMHDLEALLMRIADFEYGEYVRMRMLPEQYGGDIEQTIFVTPYIDEILRHYMSYNIIYILENGFNLSESLLKEKIDNATSRINDEEIWEILLEEDNWLDELRKIPEMYYLMESRYKTE